MNIHARAPKAWVGSAERLEGANGRFRFMPANMSAVGEASPRPIGCTLEVAQSTTLRIIDPRAVATLVFSSNAFRTIQ